MNRIVQYLTMTRPLSLPETVGHRALLEPMCQHGLAVGVGREDPPGAGTRQAVP